LLFSVVASANWLGSGDSVHVGAPVTLNNPVPFPELPLVLVTVMSNEETLAMLDTVTLAVS
jgi:hypothetical protein